MDGSPGRRPSRGFATLDADGPGSLAALRRETSGHGRERLVERYLFGLCGPMALAIHDLTGWPTVGVFDTEGGWWTDKPCHVACLGPDGYADARGTGLGEEALTAGYGGSPKVVRPFAPEAIRAMYAMRTPAEHAMAAEHVERLLPHLVVPAEPASAPRT